MLISIKCSSMNRFNESLKQVSPVTTNGFLKRNGSTPARTKTTPVTKNGLLEHHQPSLLDKNHNFNNNNIIGEFVSKKPANKIKRKSTPICEQEHRHFNNTENNDNGYYSSVTNHLNVNTQKPHQQKQRQQKLSHKTDNNCPSPTKEEWQKVLYKRQGVSDNYVSHAFLKDLRKNVNLRRFHLMEVIIAASFVTQQIILIVILILMFIYFDAYNNQYDSQLFATVTLITLFLYCCIVRSSKFQELIQIKSCLIFLIACFTMSPVLKTLTETISTDTIYAQCTIMSLIHLAFHDYGVDASIVSRPISLNAIFFASVCLASRLSTTYHAFAFLIFSTDLFVLINLFYKSLKIENKLIITVISTIITLVLMKITFGLNGFLGSIVFVLFINMIFPYLFFRMQSLKENIYGPWDEAIIDQSKLDFSEKIISTSTIINQHNRMRIESKIENCGDIPSLPPSPNVRNNSSNNGLNKNSLKFFNGKSYSHPTGCHSNDHDSKCTFFLEDNLFC